MWRQILIGIGCTINLITTSFMYKILGLIIIIITMAIPNKKRTFTRIT